MAPAYRFAPSGLVSTWIMIVPRWFGVSGITTTAVPASGWGRTLASARITTMSSRASAGALPASSGASATASPGTSATALASAAGIASAASTGFGPVATSASACVVAAVRLFITSAIAPTAPPRISAHSTSSGQVRRPAGSSPSENTCSNVTGRSPAVNSGSFLSRRLVGDFEREGPPVGELEGEVEGDVDGGAEGRATIVRAAAGAWSAGSAPGGSGISA